MHTPPIPTRAVASPRGSTSRWLTAAAVLVALQVVLVVLFE